MNKIQVDLQQETIKVDINTRIYKKEALKNVFDLLKDLCSFEISDSQNGCSVIIKPRSKGLDLNLLGFEFYTYLLHFSRRWTA